MGLFNVLKKKKWEMPPQAPSKFPPMGDMSDIDEPPKFGDVKIGPRSSMSQSFNEASNDIDAPPMPEEFDSTQRQDVIDEPPKPDFAQDDQTEDYIGELQPLEDNEPEEMPMDEESAMAAIEQQPDEEVEMPEEMKPKPREEKDQEEFSERLQSIKMKLHKKSKSAAFESEVERLKSENDYLKSRLDKMTSIMESLAIAEFDSRIESIHKDNSENRTKLSSVFDKLSLHSNLINETVSVRDEFSALRDSNKELKKQVDMLNDSLDSYKNTLYMLNKKVELVDNTNRVEKVENKIKEIIVYLNKITRIITR